jgi:hypothetical protein
LQDLIYRLSKVGQAIDKDDLPAAGSVLGSSSDAQWVQNVNAAFSKVWPKLLLVSLHAAYDSLLKSTFLNPKTVQLWPRGEGHG